MTALKSAHRLPVYIEALEEGGYLAICEAIRGCHAEGETVAEALENVEDVARIIIELCLVEGLPLPEELRKGPPPKIRAVVIGRA